MLKSFLVTLLLFVAGMLSAQYVWNGGGDGTSWNDAANWAQGEVPATDSIVTFNVDAVVTGTAPNNPVGVRIGRRANVVLNLDLTVGNGSTAEHAITLGDTSSLTLGVAGTTRRIIVEPTSDKQGIAIFGGSEMASLTVAADMTLEVKGGTAGINLANAQSTITNNGNILFAAAVRDGVRVAGVFTNHGTITGGALGRDLFNVKDDGRLVNSISGTITSDQPADDGIELLSGASLINDGTLILTAKDGTGSANSCIAVGDASSSASFVNNSDNVVLNGGGGDGTQSGRVLVVDTLGNFVNLGIITISGGNEGNRLYVRGNAENALGATIDLTNGRFNVPAGGIFTNNGLIASTREGSGGFVAGTAINNAFYDYANSNQFASGSMGTIVEKGFSLNNNDVRVNARNECMVDLANAPYEWFLDGASLAAASDTGAFVFPERSLMADSVILTTTIPGVEVKVINVCPEAVQTTSVFGARSAVETIALFPNPVAEGGAISLDLTDLTGTNLTVEVFNIVGARVAAQQLRGGSTAPLNIAGLPQGTYFLRTTALGKHFSGRFTVQ